MCTQRGTPAIQANLEPEGTTEIILQRTNIAQINLLPSQSKSWVESVRKTPSSLPTQRLLHRQNLQLPPKRSILFFKEPEI